jgi:hypothetical protein
MSLQQYIQILTCKKNYIIAYKNILMCIKNINVLYCDMLTALCCVSCIMLPCICCGVRLKLLNCFAIYYFVV